MVCDTIVECPKCGRRQHLEFVNGLKNGWSKCCGYTMPIVHCTADIEKATKEAIKAQCPISPAPTPKKVKEPWSVS